MSLLKKRGILLLLLSSLVISVFPLTLKVKASPTTWIIETVDAAADVGLDSSIVTDSDDHPHIAYHDKHWQNLKYAQWTGSTWSIVVVDSAGWYNIPSLALDSNGYPHISYHSNCPGPVGCLKYVQWTGTAWSIETVHASAYVDPISSLALDSIDNAHIGYTVNGGTADDDLGYAKWTGVAWSLETVDSAGWTGELPSLALDSNGYPHISYYKQYIDDLRYAQWTGTAWSLETVESTGYAGMQSSIAVDSSDNPHISYTHGTVYEYQNRTLKHARWTGTAWNIETVDAAADVGLNPSLALDSSGNPHISYTDWTNKNLKYARWTGSAWSIEVVDAIGDTSGGTSLALDSEDRPHISYYDATNKNLKYATTSDEYFETVSHTLLDTDSDGQNDAVKAQMNVDTTDSGTVRVTVHAFLVDPSAQYADLKSSSWNIIGQVVDWMHPNASITLYVPAGYAPGPANYMLMLTLFDSDGLLEDSYQQTNIYLYPSSTTPPAPTPTIESCNMGGTQQDSFEPGEIVFAKGSGFSPSTTYDFYVVVDQATWTDGMTIPERVLDTEPHITSDAQGNIEPTSAWHFSETVGGYDIVVDVNGNGQYDVGIDALDDSDIEVTAGFVISEAPSSDTTPPSITISSPESGTSASSEVSLTFTVDEPTTWMAYSLDGQENQTIDGNTTLFDLTEGVHNLILYAEDTSGNIGAQAVLFTVEAGEPEPQPELFPTWTVIAIVVVVAGAAAVILIYFLRSRRVSSKDK